MGLLPPYMLHYLARFPSDSPVSNPHMNVSFLRDDQAQVGPEPSVGGPGVGGDHSAALHQREGCLALGAAGGLGELLDQPGRWSGLGEGQGGSSDLQVNIAF